MSAFCATTCLSNFNRCLLTGTLRYCDVFDQQQLSLGVCVWGEGCVARTSWEGSNPHPSYREMRGPWALGTDRTAGPGSPLDRGQGGGGVPVRVPKAQPRGA